LLEYWLHVTADMREQRFDRKPRLHALRVIVLDGGIEETRTTSIDTGYEEIIFVRPRGNDWELFDATDDAFSVWRRPRGSGEGTAC
jgi:hypothetical protein